MPMPPKWYLSFKLETKILYAFLIPSAILYVCHISLFFFITMSKLDEQYKLGFFIN